MYNFVKNHPNFFVIGVYIILTLVMTVPVIFKITTDIPNMTHDNDAFQVLAQISEVAQSIQLENFKDYFRFLYPVNLFSIFNYLLIFHLIFGEPLAYNIVWLASFVLSALGVYLLTLYLTKSKIGSFVSGLIYAFSPYHLGQAQWGHFGGTHIEFIPFLVLFLLKFIEKPNIKNSIFSAIFFLLTIRGDPHSAVFLTIFLVVFFIYYYKTRKQLFLNKKFITYVAITGLFGLIVMLWYYLPLIKIAESENNWLKPPLSHAIRHSHDLAGFLIPSTSHTLLGDFFSNITSHFAGNSTYLGFVVLFFVIIAFINRKKKVIFWSFVAFLFCVFSLGPFLHFWGLIEPRIPLFYLFLYRYIPWFDNIRDVTRAFVFALLSISILAGFGIEYFLQKYNKNLKSKFVVPLIITFLILFEFLIIPINTTAINVPPFYNKLASEQGDFAILQIPGSTSYPFASLASYYKTIHKKQIINGYSFARIEPGKWNFQENTPVINTLLYNFPRHGSANNDIINHPYSEISNDILSHYKIKYIIIDKTFVGEGQEKIGPKHYVFLRNFIENVIRPAKILEDEKMVVYKVDLGQPDVSYLTLGDNWQDIKRGKDIKPVRGMLNDSTLKIVNLSSRPRALKIDLTLEASKSKTEEQRVFRKLEVYFNEIIKGSFIISSEKEILELYFDNIRPGESMIKFRVFDEYDRLIRIQDNKPEDPTINFFDITYSNIDKIDMPDFYRNLADDKDDYSILQIPIQTSYTFGAEEYNQRRIYNKKIISYSDFLKTEKEFDNGIDKYFEKSPIFNFENLPIIKELLFFKQWDEKGLTVARGIFSKTFYSKIGQKIFDHYNIKYIVLHKKFLNPESLSLLKEFIASHLDLNKITDNNDLLVYEVKRVQNDDVIVILFNNNWGKLLGVRRPPMYLKKEAFNNATLELKNFSDKSQAGQLSFNTWTCKSEVKFLDLYFNGSKLRDYAISSIHQQIKVDIEDIKPGSNTLIYKIYNEEKKEINPESGTCPIFIADVSINSK